MVFNWDIGIVVMLGMVGYTLNCGLDNIVDALNEIRDELRKGK